MTVDDTTHVVETSAGRVRGRAAAHGRVFHAIPYAAAPADGQRFAAPRPPQPWTGVRDATTSGPTAPQPRRHMLGVLDMSPYFGPGWIKGADYLTVDVWTPHEPTHDAPVMVFVHGGGFTAGSPQAALYDGRAFARDGVVLVTVTYRLGIAGFLHLPDAPDNRGLLDVLAALRWVKDNIAAFGGAADNITVFGQSAGAILLGGLLADPASAGLVRRAILQSGSALAAFTIEQAQRVSHAAGRALNVPPTAAALADVPDERLVDVLGALTGLDLTTSSDHDPLNGITPFSLVVDQQPVAGLTEGRAAAVDLLVGSNLDEAALYLAPLGRTAASTEQDVLALAARFHRDPEAVVHAVLGEAGSATAQERGELVLSDSIFRYGTRQTADAHATSASGTTHSYEFGWRSDAVDGRLGACHTMELPFVFGTVDMASLHGPNRLLGETPPPSELTGEMHDSWIRFATSGHPGWPVHRPAVPHVHRFG